MKLAPTGPVYPVQYENENATPVTVIPGLRAVTSVALDLAWWLPLRMLVLPDGQPALVIEVPPANCRSFAEAMAILLVAVGVDEVAATMRDSTAEIIAAPRGMAQLARRQLNVVVMVRWWWSARWAAGALATLHAYAPCSERYYYTINSSY